MSGFAQVSAPPKPYLICRGRISNIGEAKATEPKDAEKLSWVMQSARIEGYGASENVFYIILWRPEWFQEGFEQSQIGGTPKQVKAQQFLYRRNIFNKDAAAFLLAAVGFDQDQYVALAEALRAIEEPASPGNDDDGNPIPGIFSQDYYNAVTDVLNQFCVGNDFGYILKQGSEVLGEDENGKRIYGKTDKYEVDEFFELTEKNLTNKLKRAEKAEPGTVKYLIDAELPF